MGDNNGSVSVTIFNVCEQCGQVVESNCPYCPHEDFGKENLPGGQAISCVLGSRETASRKEERELEKERRLHYDGDDRDQT